MNVMYTVYGGMKPYHFGMSNIFLFSFFAMAVAIILGTILYFTFMSKSNENKFSGFLDKCYSFFTFKSFIFENVLKFLYIIGFIFLTVYGLLLLFVRPIYAIVILVGGNLALRMSFEFALSIFVIKDHGCKCDTSNGCHCMNDEFLYDDYDYCCGDENCDCCRDDNGDLIVDTKEEKATTKSAKKKENDIEKK